MGMYLKWRGIINRHFITSLDLDIEIETVRRSTLKRFGLQSQIIEVVITVIYPMYQKAEFLCIELTQ